MHVESRVLGKPRFYVGVLVGCVVISDQVKLLFLGRAAINLPQEAQPLLVAMFCQALANDTAIERVHRGKQCRHTIALVIMRHRLRATSLHWQSRLRPVKRLDLGLLVTTEDQCVFRWIKIQPDDVFQFLGEVLIVRHLERHHPMRFEPVRLPDTPHARRTYTDHRCHAPRAPMRRVIRSLPRCHRHDGLDLALGNPRLAPWSRLIVLDPRQPFIYKATSPACHRASPDTHIGTNLLVRLALRCQQNQLSALGKPNRNLPASSPSLQLLTLCFGHLNFRRDSHDFSLPLKGDTEIAIKLHYL